MKRLFTLATALMLALTMMIGSAAADKIIPAKVGMLALLNTSENEAVAYHEATSIAMQELIRHGQIKGPVSPFRTDHAKKPVPVFMKPDILLPDLPCADKHLGHTVIECM